MAVTVANFEITNKQVVNVESLYKLMHEWLVEEGYRDMATGDDKFETLYLEKITQMGGKEIWVWWRTGKVPDQNSYLRYLIDIDMHVLGMSDQEVMHQGKKIATNKAEITIFLRASLDLDYRKNFEKSSFISRFKESFQKRIYKKEIDAHMSVVYNKAYRLQNTIKQHLELATFVSLPKAFHPEKGHE